MTAVKKGEKMAELVPRPFTTCDCNQLSAASSGEHSPKERHCFSINRLRCVQAPDVPELNRMSEGAPFDGPRDKLCDEQNDGPSTGQAVWNSRETDFE